MNAKLKKVKKVSVLVCCVSLLLGPIAGGGAAERPLNEDYRQGSILERVTKIEDPELGELIRQALGNSPELANDQTARAALVKRVTEAYLQIKMLDSQIAETNKRIESPRTTEAIRAELMLVRMELETKLETQLAELRETMNLVPEAKYKHPVNALDTWLALDVISGDSVSVYTYSKPFYEREHVPWGETRSPSRLDKILSAQEAIAYVKDLIEGKEHFPLRLEIFRNVDGSELAEKLKKQIDQIVEDAKLDMNPVEVFLVGVPRPTVHVRNIVLIEGTKGYSRDNPERVLTPVQIWENINGHCLRWPGFLPTKVYIEFDEQSKDAAFHMANTLRTTARELKAPFKVDLLSRSFGQRKPVETLNSWLALDVIGEDALYVFEHSKPYREVVGDWPRVSPVRLMSQEEMVAHVRHLTENKEKLPLRVDIFRNEAGSKLSEEIYEHIVRIIRNANLEAEAEVNLYGERYPAGAGGWHQAYVLKQGKWYVAGGEGPFEFTLPNFLHNIHHPGFLPYTLHIQFDHESKHIAKDIVEGMQKAARELGIEQFVKVEAKATEHVNSWLALDVIADDTVRVFKYSKPYNVRPRLDSECHPVGVKTPAEAAEYVKEFVKSEEQFPLILDIHRNQATIKTSEELYKKINQMVEDMLIEKDVAVYLDERVYPGYWLADMTLKQGKAYWRDAENPWDPQFLISHMVEWNIARPGCCPFKLTIKFDHESKDLSTKMAEATKKAAAELGVEEFVEVELKELNESEP